MKDPHIRLILDTSAVLAYAAGSIDLAATLRFVGQGRFTRPSGMDERLYIRRNREEWPHEGGHETGGLASNSPVTDGERLYAFFGSRGLYCLDLKGESPFFDFDDLIRRRCIQRC